MQGQLWIPRGLLPEKSDIRVVIQASDILCAKLKYCTKAKCLILKLLLTVCILHFFIPLLLREISTDKRSHFSLLMLFYRLFFNTTIFIISL